MSLLSGALIQPVSATNGVYLTLEDIQKEALSTNDVHKAATKVISLENTALGVIVPTVEIHRICSWAHDHGMKVHLDGARLWEAVAAEGSSLNDYIGHVDTLTVDFSKGLGAPMGAAVLSSSQIRNLGKAIGGGLRGCGIIASMALWAVEYEFVHVKFKGLLAAHHKAKTIATMWTRRGGRLKRPCQTNMVWVDLDNAAIERSKWNELGSRHGVRLDGERIVTHWQISQDAIERLDRVFDAVLRPQIPRLCKAMTSKLC